MSPSGTDLLRNNTQRDGIADLGLRLVGVGLQKYEHPTGQVPSDEQHHQPEDLDLHFLNFDKDQPPSDSIVEQLFEKSLGSRAFTADALTNLRSYTIQRKWKLICQDRQQDVMPLMVDYTPRWFLSRSNRLATKDLYKLERLLRTRDFAEEFLNLEGHLRLMQVTLDQSDEEREFLLIHCYKNIMNIPTGADTTSQNFQVVCFLVKTLLESSKINNKKTLTDVLVLISYWSPPLGRNNILKSFAKLSISHLFDTWVKALGLMLDDDYFVFTNLVLKELCISSLFLIISIIEGAESPNDKKIIHFKLKESQFRSVLSKMRSIGDPLINEQIEKYESIEQETISKEIMMELNLADSQFDLATKAIKNRTIANEELFEMTCQLELQIQQILEKNSMSQSCKMFKFIDTLISQVRQSTSSFDSGDSVLQLSIQKLMDKMTLDDLAKRAISEAKSSEEKSKKLEKEVNLLKESLKLSANDVFKRNDELQSILGEKEMEIQQLKSTMDVMKNVIASEKYKYSKETAMISFTNKPLINPQKGVTRTTYAQDSQNLLRSLQRAKSNASSFCDSNGSSSQKRPRGLIHSKSSLSLLGGLFGGNGTGHNVAIDHGLSSTANGISNVGVANGSMGVIDHKPSLSPQHSGSSWKSLNPDTRPTLNRKHGSLGTRGPSVLNDHMQHYGSSTSFGSVVTMDSSTNGIGPVISYKTPDLERKLSTLGPSRYGVPYSSLSEGTEFGSNVTESGFCTSGNGMVPGMGPRLGSTTDSATDSVAGSFSGDARCAPNGVCIGGTSGVTFNDSFGRHQLNDDGGNPSYGVPHTSQRGTSDGLFSGFEHIDPLSTVMVGPPPPPPPALPHFLNSLAVSVTSISDTTGSSDKVIPSATSTHLACVTPMISSSSLKSHGMTGVPPPPLPNFLKDIQSTSRGSDRVDSQLPAPPPPQLPDLLIKAQLKKEPSPYGAPPPPPPALPDFLSTIAKEKAALPPHPPPPPPPPMPEFISKSETDLHKSIPPPPPLPGFISKSESDLVKKDSRPPPPPPLPLTQPKLKVDTKIKIDMVSRALHKPSKKLKQLHWDKIQDEVVKDTFWYDMQSYSKVQELKDLGVLTEIENLFTIKDIQKKTSPMSAVMKEELLSFLPRDLSQQFGINLHMFSALTEDELVMNVIKCNFDVLSNISVLEFFNKNELSSPSNNVLKNLMPYSTDYLNGKPSEKDVTELARADRIYVELCVNLRHYWRSRSRALLVIKTYEKDYHDLVSKIQRVDDSVKAIRDSKSLKNLFMIIRELGNFMNRKQVEGFKLASLSKLSFIKDHNQKTFLHYVEKVIRTAYPEYLKFLQELLILRETSRISVEQLSADIGTFTQSVRNIEKSMKSGNLSDPKVFHPNDRILSKIKPKMDEALLKCQILEDQHTFIIKDFDKLMTYFGEKPDDSVARSTFFQKFLDFANDFKRVQADNREAEEKEKIYEKSKEMMLQSKKARSTKCAGENEDDVVDNLLKRLKGVSSERRRVSSSTGIVIPSRTRSVADGDNKLLSRAQTMLEDIKGI